MDKPESLPPWLWMNVTSLDAPLVALVWQDFLARLYPVVLYPAGRWALGLTVWAIYLADRLLDVRHEDNGNETSRHRFYRRNWRLGRNLLALVSCADLLVTFLWLRPAVFGNGLLVAAGVAVYLGVFPAERIQGTWKQPAAAVLFTTGVFLVAWTGMQRATHNLGWPAATFCALCLGNLVLVETWERTGAAGRAWRWMLLLALGCLSMAILRSGAVDSQWYKAVGISAGGLAALAFREGTFTGDARRVLADAALLVPLLLR